MRKTLSLGIIFLLTALTFSTFVYHVNSQMLDSARFHGIVIKFILRETRIGIISGYVLVKVDEVIYPKDKLNVGNIVNASFGFPVIPEAPRVDWLNISVGDRVGIWGTYDGVKDGIHIVYVHEPYHYIQKIGYWSVKLTSLEYPTQVDVGKPFTVSFQVEYDFGEGTEVYVGVMALIGSRLASQHVKVVGEMWDYLSGKGVKKYSFTVEAPSLPMILHMQVVIHDTKTFCFGDRKDFSIEVRGDELPWPNAYVAAIRGKVDEKIEFNEVEIDIVTAEGTHYYEYYEDAILYSIEPEEIVYSYPQIDILKLKTMHTIILISKAPSWLPFYEEVEVGDYVEAFGIFFFKESVKLFEGYENKSRTYEKCMFGSFIHESWEYSYFQCVHTLLPDIAFQKVGFDKPEPFKVGDTIYFGAIIVNQGDEDAYNFRVDVYLDGKLYDSGTISLKAHQSTTLWCDNAWKITEGTHTITWIADTTNAITESNENNNQMSRTFTIGPPPFDFKISVEPLSQTIKQGETVIFTVTVTLLTESTKTVSLSLSGHHETMDYSFSPNSGNPTFTSKLTITTRESTPTGTYTLTITGRDGGKTYSTTATLTIQEKPKPKIIISGGIEEYKPLEVFFRGSAIHVRLENMIQEERTFYFECWEDDKDLVIDENDVWFSGSEKISYRTRKNEFNINLPSDMPIGLYRLRIEGTDYVSNNFWVIFNPTSGRLSQEEIKSYWTDEFTHSRRLSPAGKVQIVRTSHHKEELMLCIASIAGREWPLTSENRAIDEFKEWINRHLENREGVDPPSNIMEYVNIIKSEIGKPEPDWPDADCDGFSSFLVALARAVGIPARMITGKGLPVWAHAWVETFYEGKWQVWDPAYNRGYRDDYKAFTDWHKKNSGLWLLWFVYDELAVNRGKDYGALFGFGTSVMLQETGSKLYLHVYDSIGRHVGFNYMTGEVEVQVPGAQYYDSSNGTIIILLPLNITDFTVFVDAKYAEDQTEFYSLTVIMVRDTQIVQEEVVRSSVRKGSRQGYAMITKEEIMITPPKTQYYLTVESAYGNPTGEGFYESGESATFSISPTLIDHGNGTRHVFAGWDGDATVPAINGSVVMDSPKRVKAEWKTQYYLTVLSKYGEVRGSGWYDAGLTAEFSVAPTGIGFLIQQVFTGWSGDSTATSSTATIMIDDPKTVIANWRTDYTQLYIFSGIIVVIILASLVFLLKRRQGLLPFT